MRHIVYTIAITLLTFASCKSHKDAVTQSAAQSSIVATRDSSATRHSSGYDWSRLVIAADTLTISITADSVTTPGGATIHRPAIRASAKRPGVQLDKASIQSTDEAIHCADSASVDTSSSHESQSRHDTVAVTEPPDKWAWLIAAIVTAAMLIAAVLWLWHRKRQ